MKGVANIFDFGCTGCISVEQLVQISILDTEIRRAGIDRMPGLRMVVSYPEAAEFADLTDATVYGMPVKAGPLGIMLEVVQ